MSDKWIKGEDAPAEWDGRIVWKTGRLDQGNVWAGKCDHLTRCNAFWLRLAEVPAPPPPPRPEFKLSEAAGKAWWSAWHSHLLGGVAGVEAAARDAARVMVGEALSVDYSNAPVTAEVTTWLAARRLQLGLDE